jgi:hypothetical protein
MQAIVICTVNNPGIYICLESINQYNPDIPIFISSNNLELWGNIRGRIKNNIIFRSNNATNFGDAYNALVDYAFGFGKYDSLIIANDDIVITPDTNYLLQKDYEYLNNEGFKIGLLGARSDYVLPSQNIRFPLPDDERVGVKYKSEDQIKMTKVIAPIYALITKEAWGTTKFAPINWYGDNIFCSDLEEKGFRHFVSRAYVHHAGSQTIGKDFKKCHEEPREWIKTNRPDMYEVFYGRDS